MDELKAKEVLVFDSSTFIHEVGLTSDDASALRHYLHLRGTKLAVPQVVAKECERRLSKLAMKCVKDVNGALDLLSRLYGRVNGWTPPNKNDIAARVKALACGEAFDAFLLNEPPELLQRAKERSNAQRPPSHKKDSPRDCRIWEQCLELLRHHDVIFVSNDKDFCGHQQPEQLHPQLKTEADGVPGGGCLMFHYGMDSLLSDLLRDEIPQLAAEKVFTFVYESVADEVSEFEEKSGCHPESTGTVEQKMFSTSRNDVVEVRLKVKDSWRNAEGGETLEFKLSGSCLYHLSDSELCDLSVFRIGLYKLQPDGTLRAMTGSYHNISAIFYGCAEPIQPGPVDIDQQRSRIGVTKSRPLRPRE